ncbi:MAG: hypothetical protein IPI03_08315 [Rubrivivax sp.]|nr:hypothetical protein [Rubrivivax sp.]
MAQVMDARSGMLATSTPPQLIAQPGEHMVDPAQRQRAARRSCEDRHAGSAGDEPLARAQVAAQRTRKRACAGGTDAREFLRNEPPQLIGTRQGRRVGAGVTGEAELQQ